MELQGRGGAKTKKDWRWGKRRETKQEQSKAGAKN